MNILFYLFQNIDSASGSIGGIERHSLILKEGLEPLGYKFFYAFSHYNEQSTLDYSNSLLINSKTSPSFIRSFIINKGINIIHIQQNDGSEIRLFKKAIAGLKDVRIVTTYHFCPGYELDDLNVKDAWIRCIQSKDFYKKLRWLRRICLLPYYRYKKRKRMVKKFKLLYCYSHPLIFLCDEYIDLFSKYVNHDCHLNSTVINNCTSFDRYYEPSKLVEKQKEIIIVSRLEETYKRLSIAINIWKRIQEEGKFSDWKMLILGEGYSYEYYKELIKDVPNIALEGRKDSQLYFENAAIYLNTSRTEGWCLCCGEAMQMGVVPISFSSWAAVFDIIDDSINGFIVQEGDLEQYYKRIIELMGNEELRLTMASAAIEKSKKFSKEKFLLNYRNIYEKK